MVLSAGCELKRAQIMILVRKPDLVRLRRSGCLAYAMAGLGARATVAWARSAATILRHRKAAKSLKRKFVLCGLDIV